MRLPTPIRIRVLRGAQRLVAAAAGPCLLLPLRGDLWLQDALGPRRLRRGELLLRESGSGVSLGGSRGSVSLLVEFAAAAEADPHWALLLATGQLSERGLARAALRWIGRADGSAFAEAAGALVEGWLQRCPGRSPALRGFRLRPLLRARSYLQRAPRGDDCLRHAAALATLSRCHFSRVFQRVFGIGPAELRRRASLEQALGELQSAGRPVWHAAQRAGFARSSSFARACRRHYAATPGQLRDAGYAGSRTQSARLAT